MRELHWTRLRGFSEILSVLVFYYLASCPKSNQLCCAQLRYFFIYKITRILFYNNNNYYYTIWLIDNWYDGDWRGGRNIFCNGRLLVAFVFWICYLLHRTGIFIIIRTYENGLLWLIIGYNIFNLHNILINQLINQSLPLVWSMRGWLIRKDRPIHKHIHKHTRKWETVNCVSIRTKRKNRRRR